MKMHGLTNPKLLSLFHQLLISLHVGKPIESSCPSNPQTLRRSGCLITLR